MLTQPTDFKCDIQCTFDNFKNNLMFQVTIHNNRFILKIFHRLTLKNILKSSNYLRQLVQNEVGLLIITAKWSSR